MYNKEYIDSLNIENSDMQFNDFAVQTLLSKCQALHSICRTLTEVMSACYMYTAYWILDTSMSYIST